MILKADTAAGLAKAAKSGIWAVLIHGEDEGVANDQARALIGAWNTGGSAEVTSLSEEEIRRDIAGFFDALEARSLLGEARILRVRTNGDKLAKPLLEAVEAGEKTADRFGAKLVVTTGTLAKKSKLRKGFEDARLAGALHVSADDTDDVIALVSDALARDGVEIEAAALARFAGGLPGHRRLAHMEIEKLALYGVGLGRAVTVADVDALVATDVEHAARDFVGHVLDGKASPALAELDRLMLAGQSTIALLRALQREAQRLLAAHGLGGARQNVGMQLRPPVFAAEWPSFQARLKRWSGASLARLLARIYECEHGTKLAGPTAEARLRQLVNDLGRALAAGAAR